MRRRRRLPTTLAEMGAVFLAGCVSAPAPMAGPKTASEPAKPVQVAQAAPPAESPYRAPSAISTTQPAVANQQPAVKAQDPEARLEPPGREKAEAPPPEPPAPPYLLTGTNPAPPLPPAAVCSPAVVDALRCLMEKRPGDALARLDAYDKPTQDLLLRLLPLVARLGEANPIAADDLAVFVEQLQGAGQQLRPQAALALDRMCYCKRISKFGDFDPLPPDHPFRPGELVQVYVEVRNFACEKNDGFFETRLASSVEIPAAGKWPGWRQDFPDKGHRDRSRSPRHDYFQSYSFCLPENIPPGDYRLVIRIADMVTPQRLPAERFLRFRVTTRPQAEAPRTAR